jgi:6-phosphofructo-2-kinase/fructose-2,6-biphosphatase 2
MGYKVEIFNVGNYRRKHLGAVQTHDFFNPDNVEAEAQRRAVAKMAFEDMTATIQRDGLDVAIFDATNTTVDRRAWLRSGRGGRRLAPGVHRARVQRRSHHPRQRA